MVEEDWKVAYNAAWLVEKLGPPGPIKFHIEYITTGRKYIGTSMMASTISEVVEKVIKDAGNNTVGRISFSPVTLHDTCSFQLMNCERII